MTQSSAKIWHWNILFTNLRYKNLTGLEKVLILHTVSEWVQLCVNKMAKVINFFHSAPIWAIGWKVLCTGKSDLEKVQFFVNKMAKIKCLFFILCWFGYLIGQYHELEKVKLFANKMTKRHFFYPTLIWVIVWKVPCTGHNACHTQPYIFQQAKKYLCQSTN